MPAFRFLNAPHRLPSLCNLSPLITATLHQAIRQLFPKTHQNKHFSTFHLLPASQRRPPSPHLPPIAAQLSFRLFGSELMAFAQQMTRSGWRGKWKADHFDGSAGWAGTASESAASAAGILGRVEKGRRVAAEEFDVLDLEGGDDGLTDSPLESGLHAFQLGLPALSVVAAAALLESSQSAHSQVDLRTGLPLGTARQEDELD